MSVQTVLEFWAAAQENEQLQASLRAGMEGKEGDAAFDAIQGVGRDAGYEFTVDEYEAARQELPKLVLAGDDPDEGDVSGFLQPVGSQLIAPGGALQPGGILRRNGMLNGRWGSTSSLYTQYRGY